MSKIKTIATEVSAVAASFGAVIAAVVNIAPSAHIPAPEVAILVAVGSVLSTIVIEAQQIASAKIAARKAAKSA